MTTPWVGKECDEYRAVCVYSDGTGLPQCNEAATLHVAVEDLGYGTVDAYGVIALATCERHAQAARVSARFLEEHAYEGFCGFPGTLWVNNRCVLDDSGQEPARQAVAREVIPA